MPWRITYWRGNTRVREMTTEDSPDADIAGILEWMATYQADLLSAPGQRAAGIDQEAPTVRSNRSGSMLWTTGKEFHYTAEWYLRGPRKRQPS